MFGTGTMRRQEPLSYATKRDFCRIFEESMSPLYLLSFLLTGEQAAAEQCFVAGLHMAQEGNLVFKEWAESWARRTIILNAIRMIRPRLNSESPTVAVYREAGHPGFEDEEINAIVALPDFERFVVIMSVLEDYSDHECSLHLKCTVGEIRAARTRALKLMGNSAKLHRNLVPMPTRQTEKGKDSEPEQQFETLPRMAV